MRIDELIQQLTSTDKQQRDAARDQLIQAGAEAVPALVDLLRDPDRESPHQMSYILQQIKQPTF